MNAVPVTGWYEEFTNNLGEPLMDGMWTQNRTICHRSFRYVNVTVNLTSQSADIIWNLTNIEPTNEPTNIPTNIPTTMPTDAPNNNGMASSSSTTTTPWNRSLDGNYTASKDSGNNGDSGGGNGEKSGNNGNDGSSLVLGLIVTFVVLIVLAGLFFGLTKKFGWVIKCENGCCVVTSENASNSSDKYQLIEKK